MKKITVVLLIGLSLLTVGLSQGQNSSGAIQKSDYKQIADSLILDTIFSRLDMQNKKYNWAMDKGIENEQSINALNQSLQELSTQINELQKNQSGEIHRLAGIVQANKENIEKTAESIDIKIKDSDNAISEKIESIGQTVNKGSIFWIIGLIAAILLAILLYILLRKQMLKQKTGLDNNIQDARKKIENTRKELEKEAFKLDEKLVEVLNAQLKLMANQEEGLKEIPKQEKKSDHSLALKVADEIVRMGKNIAKMESNTKGIKPLVKGIERIEDNFKANGYEMVQLLGVEYNDGIEIDVINFIDDENIPEGKRIITKIIKPQVNYNGVLIQRAQVDVSQN